MTLSEAKLHNKLQSEAIAYLLKFYDGDMTLAEVDKETLDFETYLFMG